MGRDDASADAAIRALLAEYCARMDAGDFTGVAALFAHATWRNAQDPATVVAHGAVAIERLLRASIRLYDGSPREQHVVSNVVVEVDADGCGATARSVYLVLMAAPGFPLQATGAGRYVDRFRHDGARWQFADRLFVPELRGDQRAHHIQDRRARDRVGHDGP
jgi:hypothetical protein